MTHLEVTIRSPQGSEMRSVLHVDSQYGQYLLQFYWNLLEKFTHEWSQTSKPSSETPKDSSHISERET